MEDQEMTTPDFRRAVQETTTPDFRRAKAAIGFEPMIKALQAHALPLGYAAVGEMSYHGSKTSVNVISPGTPR